jgi:hypothetical protein
MECKDCRLASVCALRIAVMDNKKAQKMLPAFCRCFELKN